MVSKPDEILYPPWLSANYRSQMDAIRALFNRLNQSEDDLQERILEVEEYAVEATDEPNECRENSETGFSSSFLDFPGDAAGQHGGSHDMLAPTVESAISKTVFAGKSAAPVPFPEDADRGG